MAIALIAGGFCALVLNHMIALFGERVYPALILVGTVGIAGGAVVALGPQYEQALLGKPGDAKHQAIAGLIMILGVLGGVCVWVFGYDSQQTMAFRDFLKNLF